MSLLAARNKLRCVCEVEVALIRRRTVRSTESGQCVFSGCSQSLSGSIRCRERAFATVRDFIQSDPIDFSASSAHRRPFGIMAARTGRLWEGKRAADAELGPRSYRAGSCPGVIGCQLRAPGLVLGAGGSGTAFRRGKSGLLDQTSQKLKFRRSCCRFGDRETCPRASAWVDRRV